MVKKLSEPKIIQSKNKKTGVVYLYQSQHYWDSEKKQTRHVRRCIGKLDGETQEPIYNHRYTIEQGLQQGIGKERITLIQPIGRMLLLEKVFVQSKLRLHLNKVFSKKEIAQIKALVFYLVGEDNQLSNASLWLEQNYHEKPHLGFDEIKDLLKTLKKSRQNQFFENWGAGSGKTEYHLYDLASEASYKSHNSFLYYGHNRDKEALEKNNIIIVTDKKNNRPCNYTVLGGNMCDIPTLDILPFRVGLDSLRNTTLVLNRVFYSHDRVRLLMEENQRLLIRIPQQKKWLAKLINEHKTEIMKGPSFKTRDGTILKVCTILEQGVGFVHIYYDASWRKEQKRNLANILFACTSELLENNLVDEHQRLYDEYFEVKSSAKGYRRVSYRKDPQEVFEESNAGYWALLTNCEEDPQQALQIYSTRNQLEAEWNDMKNEEDCHLLEVHDPYIFSGRAFLQFLSLVMTTHMDRVLTEHNMGSYKKALSIMDRYAKVRFENLMRETYTIPNEKQKAIAKIFKLKLRE